MRTRSFGWMLMMIAATLIAAIASRYLALDPATYFEEQRSVFLRREPTLLLHVTGSLTALLVGPWQLARRIRARSIKLHRTIGMIYVAGCAVGGTAGVMLATTALGGAAASAGFMLLGSLWLATTATALVSIYRGDAVSHRRWMVRSYALCFAAVTLRLDIGVFEGLSAADLLGDVTFTQAYTVIAWISWIPNLAIAWWFTRGTALERAS